MNPAAAAANGGLDKPGATGGQSENRVGYS